MAWIGGVALLATATLGAGAASTIPPPPERWVSDRAGMLSAPVAAALDSRLEAFERERGAQIVLAIFRALPQGEAVEEWTQRVAESWRVGSGRQDDGAVLFIFVDDRVARLEVGYGLEATLPDLAARTLLDQALVPHLAAGDWDGGLTAVVDSLIAALRGEPSGTAQTLTTEGRNPSSKPPRARLGLGEIVALLLILALISLLSRASRRGRWRSGPWGGGGFGGFGGGSFGGGGGFSGGGGSFGGGGASSRW